MIFGSESGCRLAGPCCPDGHFSAVLQVCGKGKKGRVGL